MKLIVDKLPEIPEECLFSKHNREVGYMCPLKHGVCELEKMSGNSNCSCLESIDKALVEIVSKAKPKKKQMREDGSVWTYMSDSRCWCSSNCYHLEYDGTIIQCVCNSCGNVIATIDSKFKQEFLNKGIWR